MNFDDFGDYPCPDTLSLAYKLQAYMKSKKGDLLDSVVLKHKEDRYYWCVLSKKFVMVNGNTEFYLLPWRKDKKNQCYLYCHHLFAQGAVLLVPEEEIVYVGFN